MNNEGQQVELQLVNELQKTKKELGVARDLLERIMDVQLEDGDGYKRETIKKHLALRAKEVGDPECFFILHDLEVLK